MLTPLFLNLKSNQNWLFVLHASLTDHGHNTENKHLKQHTFLERNCKYQTDYIRLSYHFVAVEAPLSWPEPQSYSGPACYSVLLQVPVHEVPFSEVYQIWLLKTSLTSQLQWQICKKKLVKSIKKKYLSYQNSLNFYLMCLRLCNENAFFFFLKTTILLYSTVNYLLKGPWML